MAVPRYLASAAILTVFTAVSITASLAAGVDAASQADNSDCLNSPCRAAKTIEIPLRNGAKLQFAVERSPYLTSDGHIVIQPGERLVFHFSVDGDQIGLPQFVRAEALPDMPVPDLNGPAFEKMNKDDPNTFAIAAEIADSKVNGTAKDQLKDEQPDTLILAYRPIPGSVGMMLTIEHNFPKQLKLSVFMMRPTQNGFELKYTDTCSIVPELASMENWREPLGGLILESFRFLPDANQICE